MEMHRCGNSWVCCDCECMNCSATKITISNRTGDMGAETEYIDREAAKRTLVQDYAYAAAKLLDEVPATDVAPWCMGGGRSGTETIDIIVLFANVTPTPRETVTDISHTSF